MRVPSGEIITSDPPIAVKYTSRPKSTSKRTNGLSSAGRVDR